MSDPENRVPHPVEWVVPVVGSTVLVGAVFWMVSMEGFTAATIPTMTIGVIAIMALDTVVKESFKNGDQS